MQFIVTAYDYQDEQALKRRMAVRDEHVALGNKFRDEGKMLFGAAILNEEEEMIGSVLVCDFESREELDTWLTIEPYVTGKVWDKIEIVPCKVGPSFVKN